jgi:hypothetical protein
VSGARLYVFAVIGHVGRRIRVLGATTHPTASGVAWAARNLVVRLEDAGCRARFMIRDRDDCDSHRPHQGVADAHPPQSLPAPITAPDAVADLDIRRRDRLGDALP